MSLALLGSPAEAALRNLVTQSSTSLLDMSADKALTVNCPSGKRAVGAGWAALNGSDGIIDGTVLHTLPDASGSSWTVKVHVKNPSVPWKLTVKVNCADEAAFPSYQIVTLTAPQAGTSVNPTCPEAMYMVAAGWTALNGNAAPGTINWEGLILGQDPFGDYYWADLASSHYTSTLKSQVRLICVSRTDLPSYERKSGFSAENTHHQKEATANCSAGKVALGGAWISPRSCSNCGNWWSQQTYSMPLPGDTGWKLRSNDTTFPLDPIGTPSNFAWMLQAQVICAQNEVSPPPTCGVTLETMTFNAMGPTTWPAACWKPFERFGAPFSKRIPPDARYQQLHPNSNAIVTQLLTGDNPGEGDRPGELVGRLDGHAGEPTYYSQPSDPEYILRCRNDPYQANGHCTALEGTRVRIPAWARPEGGDASIPGPSATDAHITVIDRVARVQYDFWQVQTAPLPPSPQPDGTPPELVISAGNRISLDSQGLYAAGPQTTTSFGVGRNGTAGYFAGQVGKIRLEELQAGEINHALFMLVRCHKSSSTDGVVFPAAGAGRKCLESPFPGDEANAPSMGAHFFYDRSPETIDQLPLPTWKKAILKALSRYGAFVGDTANDWGFDQESGYQYSSVTNGARRWYDYGTAQGWGLWNGPDGINGTGDDRRYGRLYDFAGEPGSQQADIDDAAIIDFPNYLKVLKPCVSQDTCTD